MIARGSIWLPLVLHQALRQQVALEHLLDRLEIKIRAHVHDREIFLVELADRVGLLEVARDARMEEVDEGFLVPFGVHAHEGGELQKAGIDAPARALELVGHDADHVRAEPLDRLFLRQLVDLGRRDARVDRARHQRQARGLDVGAVLREHGGRDQRRHRRLADGDDMAVLADEVDEVDEMLGVVVEREIAVLELTLRGLIQSVMKT